jgi:hypothetical protein
VVDFADSCGGGGESVEGEGDSPGASEEEEGGGSKSEEQVGESPNKLAALGIVSAGSL